MTFFLSFDWGGARHARGTTKRHAIDDAKMAADATMGGVYILNERLQRVGRVDYRGNHVEYTLVLPKTK